MNDENLEALKYLIGDRSFEGLREIIADKMLKLDQRLDKLCREAIFEEISTEVRLEACDLRGQVKGLRSVLSVMNKEYVETLLAARRQNGNNE
jgi:hypothetical protein